MLRCWQIRSIDAGRNVVTVSLRCKTESPLTMLEEVS